MEPNTEPNALPSLRLGFSHVTKPSHEENSRQLLSKHSPARIKQHESVIPASALGLSTTASYLIAQRHPGQYQSERC